MYLKKIFVYDTVLYVVYVFFEKDIKNFGPGRFRVALFMTYLEKIPIALP